MTGWLKLHNDIIHDPKIRALAFEDRWHFVALLCLKNDGTLDESDALRHTLLEIALGLHGKDLQSLKDRLLKLHLIKDDWTPANWDKRQGSKDATAAARQRKYREKLKRDKETRDAVSNGEGDAATDRDVTHNVTGRSKKKEVRSNGHSSATGVTFADFWDAYRKKRKRPDAEKAWGQITPHERDLAYAAASKRATQDPDWLKQSRQFQPYAGTYLRGKQWEDEWSAGESEDDIWGDVT